MWFNLGATSLASAIEPGRGFLLEFVVTSLLIFVVLSSAADRYSLRHLSFSLFFGSLFHFLQKQTKSTSKMVHLAPLPIGFAVSVGVMTAVYWTGGSLK